MKDIGLTNLDEHMEMYNKLIIDLSAVAEQYFGTQETSFVQLPD